MLRGCANIEILDVELPFGEILGYPPVERAKRIWFEGVVHVAPPDIALGLALADDVLVFRTPSRVRRAVDRQRALVGDRAPLALQRMLVEHRAGQVPVHVSLGLDPVSVQVSHRLLRERCEGCYLDLPPGARVLKPGLVARPDVRYYRSRTGWLQRSNGPRGPRPLAREVGVPSSPSWQNRLR